MKKYILTIVMALGFVVQGFAQNNDMKARMEYEDAETAYQSQDYQKAVTHLESAEKLLGKPTAKTRYLLILALNNNLSQNYEYKDLEKLRNLTKHYVDNYTTDVEKYRDIYDLSNSLKNYPKSLEEFNQFVQEQKTRIVEKEIHQKKLQAVIDFGNEWSNKYYFKPFLSKDEFLKQNKYLSDKSFKKIDFSENVLLYQRSDTKSFEINDTNFLVWKSDNEVYNYKFTFECGKDQYDNQKAKYDEIKKFAYSNFDTKYIKEATKYTMLSISIPTSNEEPDKIEYYIIFTFATYNKKSMISVNYTTSKSAASVGFNN